MNAMKKEMTDDSMEEFKYSNTFGITLVLWTYNLKEEQNDPASKCVKLSRDGKLRIVGGIAWLRTNYKTTSGRSVKEHGYIHKQNGFDSAQEMDVALDRWVNGKRSMPAAAAHDV